MDEMALSNLLKSSSGLAMCQVLRHRIRYLVDGGMIGSREY
jgi:hypothetical protein